MSLDHGALRARRRATPHSEWPLDCTGPPRWSRDGPAPRGRLQRSSGPSPGQPPGEGEPMHRLSKLAVLAMAIAATPLAASARSTYLSAFNTKYKTSGTVLDTCNTCHGSGGTSTFNPYGQ